MRIGSCSLINEWKMIADIGYDYVETNFSRIVRLTDEEFEDAKLQLAESGLKLEACNGFFHSKFVLYAYDPETPVSSGGYYPQVKTCVLGVSITFR